MSGRFLSPRKIALIISLLLLLFAGCTCAARPESAPSQAPTEAPSASPDPTPVPAVTVGGKVFSPFDRTLDLSDPDIDIDTLCEKAGEFQRVERIDMGLMEPDAKRIQQISRAFPDAELFWRMELPCGTVSESERVLDLSGMPSGEIGEICGILPLLKALEKIVLIPEDGVTSLEPDVIGMLSEAAPAAEIEFCYDLFGQRAGNDTKELRYSETDIGDDGIAVFRAVLPYMKELKLLRLYDCGIRDYDAMAALRGDFPDVNVVWSIEITGSQFMTDTTLMHNPLLRDKHVHLLQYFPDIIYLDIGHNHYLTSVDFIKYLPKLQVAILSITRISDISALAGCPDLEFCELFNSHIADLSPLAGLKKLEYLNIGDMPYVRDISPIYGIESLKMVRICGSTFNWVKADQVEELKARLPGCVVSDGGGDPTTSGGWRFDAQHNYTERYALLREQMLYDIPDWKKRQSNSPSADTGE